MSFRSLPEIGRGVRVASADAQQDKIHLELGEWLFEGDDAEFLMFTERLAEFEYRRNDQTISFFASRQRNSLPIRSHRLNRAGRPLVAGRLKWEQARVDDHGSSLHVLKFDIQINPMRSLAHQPSNLDLRAGSANVEYRAFTFFERDTSSRPFGEFSLDGNDNLILDPRQYMMARAPHWGIYRRAYFEQMDLWLAGVMEVVFERLPRCESTLRRRLHYNLKSVETMWEFRCDDPIRWLTEVQPHFMAYGSSARHRSYRNVAGETSREGYSPVFTARPVGGAILKLYAKTNRRLRIEIEHDLRKFNSSLTSHTSTNLEGIAQMIDTLSEYAEREANAGLENIERAFPSLSEQRPVYDFVRQVILAAPEPELHEALLSILVNLNGIPLRSGDRFRPAVNALLRAGVLERSRRGSQFFRLSESYMEARRLLNSTLPGPTD